MLRLTLSLADQNFSRTASTGIFNVSEGLARHLARRSDVERLTVLAGGPRPADPRAAAAVETRVVRWPIASLAGRLVWDQCGAYRAAARAGNPWLLLPKGFASMVRRCPVRLAAYVHDLIPLESARRYPRSASRWKTAYLRRAYAATFRTADVLFTNTETTRTALVRYAEARRLRCPPLHVAGYGFEGVSFTADKRDEIVILLRTDPHKRADLAVAWLERWIAETGYLGRIVCLGCRREDLPFAAPAEWEWLGRTEASVCVDRMCAARAVLHFSEMEGFGMPPVEAALAGSASVYSAVPATVEAMGGAGFPFSHDDYNTFRSAMDAAMKAAPDRLAAWSRELAARHTWEKVTDRIVSVLLAA